jgi:hypothetical protein
VYMELFALERRMSIFTCCSRNRLVLLLIELQTLSSHVAAFLNVALLLIPCVSSGDFTSFKCSISKFLTSCWRSALTVC